MFGKAILPIAIVLNFAWSVTATSSFCAFQYTTQSCFLHKYSSHRLSACSEPEPTSSAYMHKSFTGLQRTSRKPRMQNSMLLAQQGAFGQTEVRKGIDRVVSALRKDSRANTELGKLQKVTIVLGYGSPQPDILAVRFNAAFSKSGKGLSSVPLPFGLGQSNVSEGRGTMVGQVKASLNVKTGKLLSCSVFRDLGYGRTFDLKV